MHQRVKQRRILAARQKLQRARADFLAKKHSKDHDTRKAAHDAYVAAAAAVRREMYR